MNKDWVIGEYLTDAEDKLILLLARQGNELPALILHEIKIRMNSARSTKEVLEREREINDLNLKEIIDLQTKIEKLQSKLGSGAESTVRKKKKSVKKVPTKKSGKRRVSADEHARRSASAKKQWAKRKRIAKKK